MKKTLLNRNAEYYADPTAGTALRKLMPPKRKLPKPRVWVLVWTNPDGFGRKKTLQSHVKM